MSPSALSRGAGGAARLRRRAEIQRRRRQTAVVALLAAVAVAVIAFVVLGGDHHSTKTTPPASAARLLPASPPKPETIATLGTLHLNLPVPQSRVTAIGYYDAGDGSLALTPAGSQANQGLVKRLVHSVVGGGGGAPHWYQLSDTGGPGTSALAVGAAPGTAVYAPVDGTIVGFGKVILNGHQEGWRIDIQPAEAPSLIVSISPLALARGLTVGEAVTTASSAASPDVTKLGTIKDLAAAGEKQALAKYTNDSGDHALLSIRQSAAALEP